MPYLILLFLLFACPCLALDVVPPTGTIQIIPPIAGEYVDFTLNLSDAGIGVASFCISNDETCTAWESYTGPVTKHWQLIPGSGMRTVYVYTQDKLGNAGLSKIMVIKP